MPLSDRPATSEALSFATYDVAGQGGIATAATVAPVGARHAAILTCVLCRHPVPDDLLPTLLNVRGLAATAPQRAGPASDSVPTPADSASAATPTHSGPGGALGGGGDRTCQHR
ncbi:hypothetical protein [Streptomyces sp. TLI_171]|uniref:hypothetical protein n=1 Tax=Streptomyces sp. TLI_171 TaxID=1938859 RepID=UPI000C4E84BD|nr:hypothetical protein [Streptomyces sp. TLI_171]RKE23687.1 hypothetical protein BX266_7178 [Streptomyces sp. TLI_171]